MRGRENIDKGELQGKYTIDMTMRNEKNNVLFLGFIAASVALVLFSYTQVDLNLTLSRDGVWQGIQKAFQYIGFYQRPLATLLYAGIIVSLYGLYMVLLGRIRQGLVDIAFIRDVIIAVTVIMVFSYPAAFSYDFFNYLFTAKTVLVYHQNPYTVTPLQFSGIDPWTNFMRWTHLSSAYTPFWILLSLAPYVIGLGYFILVLFATKFMIAGFYLLASWALSRALRADNPKQHAYGVALFSLNPLILIESLVSGHNDIVLVAFAMLSVMAYVKKDELRSWIYLSFSIAAKFMTIFLIPVYLFKKGRIWILAAMAVGLLLVLLRREFLPWYWVWLLPFVALNAEKEKLVRMAIVVSVGLVASYAPYMYFGEYSSVMQTWKTWLIVGGVGVGLMSALMPVKKSRSA